MTEQKSREGLSTLVSRNVTVNGRRTSIRLEPEMWAGLKEIMQREGCTLHRMCSMVSDYKHPDTSFTAAIRVFVMAYYKAAATDDGHRQAGHGRQALLQNMTRIFSSGSQNRKPYPEQGTPQNFVQDHLPAE